MHSTSSYGLWPMSGHTVVPVLDERIVINGMDAGDKYEMIQVMFLFKC